MDASVVEPVDAVERGPLDVFDVAPGTLSTNQLALVEAVERLCQSSRSCRREIRLTPWRRRRAVAPSSEYSSIVQVQLVE